MSTDKRLGWLVDMVVGIVVGGLLGGVVAVNLMIYSGVERGYEASLGQVFEHSALAGLVVVAALAAGPILGVVAMRRHRQKKNTTRSVTAG
jgi:hypothetical protein